MLKYLQHCCAEIQNVDVAGMTVKLIPFNKSNPFAGMNAK